MYMCMYIHLCLRQSIYLKWIYQSISPETYIPWVFGFLFFLFLLMVVTDCITLASLEVQMHPRGIALFIFHSIIDYFE